MQAEPARQSIPEVAGAEADVQLLPFGPVRADVLESGEFLFFYIGEAILHYQPRLFFKHRGMEKRFEGLSAAGGVVLAERISGVGSVAHALAYCQAVEAAANCIVPPRACFLRVLLAEMERLYNHLHYLGHLCHTTTLKVGEAQGKLLEERVKQLNTRLTGSRFLRSILTVGGLRRDLSPKGWLGAELEALREEYSVYARHLESTDSHLDRLITTGVLEQRVAFDQGATGPIQRASGFDRDLRRDHPYAAYGELPVTVPMRNSGDAHARAQVRMAEIDASIALIQRVLLLLPDGAIASECNAPPKSEGLGWSESPRGTLFYAVHFDDRGRLARVKIKSPSFSNWRVFPVHRPRQQHDGLRDQRGQLWADDRWLRSLGDNHAALDVVGLDAGQADSTLAFGGWFRWPGGLYWHAAIQSGPLHRGVPSVRRCLPDPCHHNATGRRKS